MKARKNPDNILETLLGLKSDKSGERVYWRFPLGLFKTIVTVSGSKPRRVKIRVISESLFEIIYRKPRKTRKK